MKAMILAATLTAVGATGAWAHHSYAMFDDTKAFSVTGVVKELQWANPHIWLEVVVPTGERSGSWSFEGGTIPVLKRMGWTRDLVKPGDTVTIYTNPLKNGRNGGSLVRITLPGGRTLPGGGRPTNEKTDPNLVER